MLEVVKGGGSRVTQADIENIKTYADQIARVQANIGRIARRVIHLIESGATVELGKHHATLECFERDEIEYKVLRVNGTVMHTRVSGSVDAIRKVFGGVPPC